MAVNEPRVVHVGADEAGRAEVRAALAAAGLAVEPAGSVAEALRGARAQLYVVDGDGAAVAELRAAAPAAAIVHLGAGGDERVAALDGGDRKSTV